jgi:hypothetical protein
MENQQAMNRSRLIALSAITILGAGCTTSKPLPHYNPFKISREEIRNCVKIVAVAPAHVDDDIPNATQAREELVTLLISELNSLGFQTVSPAEYEQIFNRLRDEAGGFFDPITGKGDEEKFKKVQDLCRRELATKFRADAVMYPTLVAHTAQFNGNVAVWNGVRENITYGEPDLNPWMAAIVGYNYGTVPVLSFCISLQDIEGNRMFADCGGVQSLAKMTGAHFNHLSSDKVLTDPTRNTNAVHIALEPFRDKQPGGH